MHGMVHVAIHPVLMCVKTRNRQTIWIKQAGIVHEQLKLENLKCCMLLNIEMFEQHSYMYCATTQTLHINFIFVPPHPSCPVLRRRSQVSYAMQSFARVLTEQVRDAFFE